MWFVILKTLLPDDPGAWSAQPEMLLVADDANAAYSNPRPLPKFARTLLPCIRLFYRTPRGPDAVACPTQKPHLPVSKLVVTLRSRILDTGGKSYPPRTGPGGAKR